MTSVVDLALLRTHEWIAVVFGERKIKPRAGPSIWRIAYWYASDTRVQFGYRCLRIAEYHLLH